MSQVFDSYARYYDLLYRDKDYAAEAEYVVSHIRAHSPNAKHILELGCGTGAHAEHLARMGFSVDGVDTSEEMLSRAEMRKSTLSDDEAARLSFSYGDIRSTRTGKIYDAVISLFHVMSYQTSNHDLLTAFKTAASHLHPGGLFLFDFWYGPAVLTQKPEVRIKRLEDKDIRVTRIAEPVMRVNENTVDVNYTVFIETPATAETRQVKETHCMRYLFLPELEDYLIDSGFTHLSSANWLSNQSLTVDSWAGFTTAVRL